MSAIEVGHREILRALSQAAVEFVVIGGVGLQGRGYSRATKDVDVAVAVDAANVERLNRALRQLIAREQQRGDLGTRYMTRHGLLDVLDRTEIGPYERWAENAIDMDLGDGVVVKVGSAQDLIEVKERADRPRDREALPEIRAELLAAGELKEADVVGKTVAPLWPERDFDPAAEALLGPRPDGKACSALGSRAGADRRVPQALENRCLNATSR